MSRAIRKPRKNASETAAQCERALADTPSRAELVHELEVHQVELEMQNEELRLAHVGLASARDRFIDLYDFAPIGYFTLDDKGLVREANLTGAKMLGIDRQALLGRGFSRFVAPTQTYLWHRQLRQAMQMQETLQLELDLVRDDGETFSGQLDCLSVAQPDGPSVLRVTLTDITPRKLAETDRRIANDTLDAREAERRHVSRELHEELGQRLSALKMELGSLDRKAESHDYAQRIAAILASLDEAVADVRRIAIGLRPPMLDDLGLSAAIEWVAHDTSRRLGLDIRVDLQEIDPAPDERVAIAIYRMAQDLLHHVAQHAKGCATTISLTREPDNLALSLSCETGDTASAESAAAIAALTQTLRDRAHMLGGALVISDWGEQQPFITARIPLTGKSIKVPVKTRASSAAAGSWPPAHRNT